MNEKKSLGKWTIVGLAALCFVLFAGLIGVVLNYTSIIDIKDKNLDIGTAQTQTLTNEKNQLQDCLEGNLSLITSLNEQIASKNSEIVGLQNQISSLNTNVTTLQNQISILNSQVGSLNNQVTALQNQLNAVLAPNLIKVDMKGSDDRPLFGDPRLHVWGHVCNVGSNTAYNSKLHVVLYQSGGVIAEDTYIELGYIAGADWKSVDTSIFYTGSALTGWSVTAQWTS